MGLAGARGLRLNALPVILSAHPIWFEKTNCEDKNILRIININHCEDNKTYLQIIVIMSEETFAYLRQKFSKMNDAKKRWGGGQ